MRGLGAGGGEPTPRDWHIPRRCGASGSPQGGACRLPAHLPTSTRTRPQHLAFPRDDTSSRLSPPAWTGVSRRKSFQEPGGAALRARGCGLAGPRSSRRSRSQVPGTDRTPIASSNAGCSSPPTPTCDPRGRRGPGTSQGFPAAYLVLPGTPGIGIRAGLALAPALQLLPRWAHAGAGRERGRQGGRPGPAPGYMGAERGGAAGRGAAAGVSAFRSREAGRQRGHSAVAGGGARPGLWSPTGAPPPQLALSGSGSPGPLRPASFPPLFGARRPG